MSDKNPPQFPVSRLQRELGLSAFQALQIRAIILDSEWEPPWLPEQSTCVPPLDVTAVVRKLRSMLESKAQWDDVSYGEPMWVDWEDVDTVLKKLEKESGE